MYNLLVMQTNLYACLKQLQLKCEVQNLVSIHNFSQLVISFSSETKLFILTGYFVLGFVNVKFYSHY
jgi:hypothetical protein